MWPPGGDSKLIFRKNFAKYEIFKGSPYALFPEDMIGGNLDAHKGLSHSELIQVNIGRHIWEGADVDRGRSPQGLVNARYGVCSL
ncbi:hypothetical protein FKM82_027118 [Ascaphus truei]